MTIRVDPSARRALAGGGQSVVMLVGADAVGPAFELLGRASKLVEREHGFAVEIFGPWCSPRGPFVLADVASDMPGAPDWLGRLRDVLEDLGVEHGTLSVVRSESSLLDMELVPNLVQLLVFSSPGEGMPAAWPATFARSIQWPDDLRLLLGAGGALAVDITADDVEDVLVSCAANNTPASVMTSREEPVVRGMSVYDRGLVVAIGGSGFDASQLRATRDAARDLIIELDDVVYAAMLIEPDWLAFEQGWCTAPEQPASIQQPWNLAPYVGQVVLDGFHWQLLSAGHVARRGAPPPGAEPLSGGRWELTVGEPEAWWPDALWPRQRGWTPGSPPPNAAIRERARAQLDGLVLRKDDDGYAALSQLRSNE